MTPGCVTGKAFSHAMIRRSRTPVTTRSVSRGRRLLLGIRCDSWMSNSRAWDGIFSLAGRGMTQMSRALTSMPVPPPRKPTRLKINEREEIAGPEAGNE